MLDTHHLQFTSTLTEGGPCESDKKGGSVDRVTPGLPGALKSPSDFFPLICIVADMAKGPFLGPPMLAILLLPKLDVDFPLGGPGFLSPVNLLAAPLTPFWECFAAFASIARLFKVSGFGLHAQARIDTLACMTSKKLRHCAWTSQQEERPVEALVDKAFAITKAA